MAIMGPFIDNGINPHVLSEYDLEIKKAVRHRSVIRVDSQLGVFALKKTNFGYAQAERMREIVSYLNQHKFPVPQIVPNKYGEYFIPVEKGLVYLTKWIEGKGFTLKHNQHLLMSVSMMAQMHKLGFSFKSEKNYKFVDELFIRNSWENRLDWLRRYEKRLKKKRSITTFEQSLLTYIPFVIDWGNEAIEKLNLWIIEYESINRQRRTIVHGKFHHRNVVVTPSNKLYVLDFDHVSIDTPVRDFAYFIRHYILNKENRAWSQEWVNIYQSKVDLNIAETKLLALYLLFPERMISLAKRYEQKRHHVSEEDYLKKIQVRFAQMKEMLWLIDQNKWLGK